MDEGGMFEDLYQGSSSFGCSTIEQMLAMSGDQPIDPPGDSLSTTEIRDLTPVFEDDLDLPVKEEVGDVKNNTDVFGVPRISPPDNVDKNRPKTFEERLEESYLNHQKKCESNFFEDDPAFSQTTFNPVSENKKSNSNRGNFTRKQFPFLQYQDKPTFPFIKNTEQQQQQQRYTNSLPQFYPNFRTNQRTQRENKGYQQQQQQQRYSGQPIYIVSPYVPPNVVPPNVVPPKQPHPASLPSQQTMMKPSSLPSRKKNVKVRNNSGGRLIHNNNNNRPSGGMVNNYQTSPMFVMERMYQRTNITQVYQNPQPPPPPPPSTSAPKSFFNGVRQRRNTIGTLPPRLMDLTRGRFRHNRPNEMSSNQYTTSNTHFPESVFQNRHQMNLPRSFPMNNMTVSEEEEEEEGIENVPPKVDLPPPPPKMNLKEEEFGHRENERSRRSSAKRRKKRKYSRKNVRIDDIEIDRNEIMKLFGKVRNYKGMLPGRSSDVLRDWFCDHLQSPYPTNDEKRILVEKSGLKENQVMNWFTNKRKRIWKPYILQRRKQLVEAKKSMVKKGKKTGYHRERKLRRKKY